jgi:multidrug efflux pump subunit AcrA (membrane-fusion protein)
MKTKILTFTTAVTLAAGINSAYAGAGHDHGESAFASGSSLVSEFTLTDLQIQNLDVKTAKAVKLPMQQTLDMLAFTELLPEKRATISPHFEGRIINVDVKVGEKVEKGQSLVTLQPVNVGTQKVTLSAPLDGFVMNLEAGPGDIIQTGGDIMQIGDATQMLVRGVAYETPDIQNVKVGQRAEFHLDIAPDRHIDGTVQRIDRVIDPATRTFSVYALIETPEGDVKPGLQGTIEVFLGNSHPVLAVPKKAVLGDAGSYFVYVMNGRDVERRDVVIGAKSAHHIQIKSGLFDGEDVVVKGNYQLQYITAPEPASHDDHGHEEHGHPETAHDEQEGHDHSDDHEHAH